MVKSDQSDWATKVPLVEFAMNSTVSATTGFAPFELNGAMPRMIKEFKENRALPRVELFAETVWENLLLAYDSIIESRVLQMHYANKRRYPEH